MRDKSIAVWVILGAVLLAVLNLPTGVSRSAKAVLREAMAPLQGALSSFSRKITESVRTVRGIGGVLAENQRMATELVRLRNEVRGLEALEQQNLELRRQLDFARRSDRKLIPCEVIARDITGWWQTVRLDKGSDDGVAHDMAVVTMDGLIGKTGDVSPHTCDVLLISDPACKVSVQIARTGTFGVIGGRGPAESGAASCLMDFISKNVPVQSGDEVVTSGLGGVFPPGLLVGYIDRVEMDKTGLYQHADLVPKADLAALTYAFVVAGAGSGRAPAPAENAAPPEEAE